MLLLEFLPNWVFHVLLIVGVLGLLASVVLKFIPVIKTYDFPVKVISILLIMTGVWFDGAMSNQAAWEARVAEMQVKVAEAEAQSEKTNVKIITKVVNKTQIVRTRGEDIIKYVDREIVKYDTKFAPGGVCEIPKEFIKAHNDAAEAPK
jgi:translation elongation factor EF-Tu-like GTPase